MYGRINRMEHSPGVLRGVAAVCAERKDDSLGKQMRDQNGEHHQAVRKSCRQQRDQHGAARG